MEGRKFGVGGASDRGSKVEFASGLGLGVEVSDM